MAEFGSVHLFKGRKGTSNSGKRKSRLPNIAPNTGRRSYVNVRHVERDENRNILRPLQFFERTHKPKTGVNQEAASVLETARNKLNEKIGEHNPSENELVQLEQEALRETLGPEHSGRLRGFGFGPTKSQVYGSSRGSQAQNLEIIMLKRQLKEMNQKDEEKEKRMKKMEEDLDLLRRFILSSQVNSSMRIDPQTSCS